MAIDVGPGCNDHSGSIAGPYTFVDKANAANATGTIDTVCVCAAGDMSGIEFAAFVDEGSNTLSTNGDTNGSNLSALSADCEPGTTFTSAGCDFTAFAINSGEYIGIFFSGGDIERETSGGTGFWYVQTTDHIPAASVGFSWIANFMVSVYATGTEAGGLSIPIAMHHILRH